MKEIHFADSTIELNDQEKDDARLLLPYWGLVFDRNDEKISPLLTDTTVNLHCGDAELLADIKKLVGHSGITIEARNDFPYDFIIQVKKNSLPLVVKKRGVTYNVKLNKHSQNIQTLIYKNIWLPDPSPSTSVVISEDYKTQAPEWCSYLILQSFVDHDLLRPISHITMQRYRTFVKKLGTKMNSCFAECQTFSSDTVWPEAPFELKHKKNNTKMIFPEENLFPEADEKNNYIQPFKRTLAGKKVIEPFKKTAKFVKFNPFKKGK